MTRSGPDGQFDPFASLKLSKLIHGFVNTQLIFVVAKLGIADLLADAPKTAKEFAEATGVREHRLLRVLRALCSIDILAPDEADGCFGLTPMGRLLQSNTQASQRDYAIMLGSSWHLGRWGYSSFRRDRRISI